MKRVISTILIFSILFSSTLQAKTTTKQDFKKAGLNNLLLGTSLFLLGIAPLRVEKKDISNPSLDYSNYNFVKTQIGSTWYMDASGRVKNTGNVPLKNVKIYLKYYDSSNNLVSSDWNYLHTYWLDPLPVGKEDTWNDYSSTTLGEPVRLEVSATYEYDKIYKEEKKPLSPTLATVGLIFAGLGLLMYIFPEPIERAYRKNVKFSIIAKNNYTGFLITKTF